MDPLTEIDRVFQREIDTLINVKENLSQSYADAAQLLVDTQGNIVITGMGKSGSIAQKIAATMVSTGTAAVFLHPADALHGDVGIIHKTDALLAISKSGETEEVLSVVTYAKRVGAKVICITAKPTSSLARQSELVLYTPIYEEACPFNLAPTSSTTAALVVGDALAMSLMKMKGFKPDQFALLHPAGQLGKRLSLIVSDVMRSGDKNPIVKSTDSVQHMLYEITSKLSGAVSVVDEVGFLEGLVTDYDIRRALEEGLDFFSLTIPEIMNPDPVFIWTDDNIADVLNMMEDRSKPILVSPVLDRNSRKAVGFVHLHDLVALGL